MYTKNLIGNSYFGGTGYYDNDPLQPEFLNHFVKSDYRTKKFRRKLPTSSKGEKLIELDFTAYIELFCRKSILDAILQKDLHNPNYQKEAHLLQEKFIHSDCKSFLCLCCVKEESLVEKYRLEHYRDRIYWLLIRQNELLASDMMNGPFQYIDYIAFGEYDEKYKTGEGEINFTIDQYKIFTHKQWVIIDGRFDIIEGEFM